MFETCLKLGKLQGKYNFNRNEVLFLMKENLETNQIVLCFPDGYMMHSETTCTPFWYPYTIYVPLSFPKLYIINNITTYISIFNLSQTVGARDLNFWHNDNNTSFVNCPVSHVRCHMSIVKCHLYLLLKLGDLVIVGSVISGAILSRLLFIKKMHWYPIFTYLGLLWLFEKKVN